MGVLDAGPGDISEEEEGVCAIVVPWDKPSVLQRMPQCVRREVVVFLQGAHRRRLLFAYQALVVALAAAAASRCGAVERDTALSGLYVLVFLPAPLFACPGALPAVSRSCLGMQTSVCARLVLHQFLRAFVQLAVVSLPCVFLSWRLGAHGSFLGLDGGSSAGYAVLLLFASSLAAYESVVGWMLPSASVALTALLLATAVPGLVVIVAASASAKGVVIGGGLSILCLLTPHGALFVALLEASRPFDEQWEHYLAAPAPLLVLALQAPMYLLILVLLLRRHNSPPGDKSVLEEEKPVDIEQSRDPSSRPPVLVRLTALSVQSLLDDIDLDISAGETVAVIGLAGGSALLSAIAAQVALDGGSVAISSSCLRCSKTAVESLVPDYSVAEHLAAFAATARSLPDLVPLFDLDRDLHRPVWALDRYYKL